MKIFIHHDGDMSVGIPGDELTIDWPKCDWHVDKENRENLRKGLQEFWADYFDAPKGAVGVRFEDECEECGKNMGAKLRRTKRVRGLGYYSVTEYVCTNPSCPTNLNSDYEDQDPVSMGWVGKDGQP